MISILGFSFVLCFFHFCYSNENNLAVSHWTCFSGWCYRVPMECFAISRARFTWFHRASELSSRVRNLFFFLSWTWKFLRFVMYRHKMIKTCLLLVWMCMGFLKLNQFDWSFSFEEVTCACIHHIFSINPGILFLLL